MDEFVDVNRRLHLRVEELEGIKGIYVDAYHTSSGVTYTIGGFKLLADRRQLSVGARTSTVCYTYLCLIA